ncbi:MAG: hypothetical protein H7A34_04710 [bacterium]|nr:hypothetical protein [bacterium]
MFRYKTFLLLVCAPFVFISRPLKAVEFKVPEKYGIVKESFESDSEYNVYFIQDAHCNEEAQINIYNLLNYLVSTQHIDLITMEGAAGVIDPVDLRSFPYDDAKQIVSNYF